MTWDQYEGVPVGIYREGCIFGEFEVFKNTTRVFSCFAASDLEVMVLNKKDFKRIFFQKFPDFGAKHLIMMDRQFEGLEVIMQMILDFLVLENSHFFGNLLSNGTTSTNAVKSKKKKSENNYLKKYLKSFTSRQGFFVFIRKEADNGHISPDPKTKEILQKFKFIYTNKELASVKELASSSSINGELLTNKSQISASLKSLEKIRDPLDDKKVKDIPMINIPDLKSRSRDQSKKKTEAAIGSHESFNVFLSRTLSKNSSQKIEKKMPKKKKKAVGSMQNFTISNYQRAISLVRNRRQSAYTNLKKQVTLDLNNSNKLGFFRFDTNSLGKLRRQPSALKLVNMKSFTQKFSMRNSANIIIKSKRKKRDSKNVDVKKLIQTLEKYKRQNIVLKFENKHFREEREVIKTKLTFLDESFRKLTQIHSADSE